MKRWMVLTIGLAAMALAGCSRGALVGSAADSIAGLQTETAAAGPLTATVGATGSVRANQSALLTFETTGRVASVAVQLGDQVRAGQVLAAMEASSLPSSISLAQVDLVAAERELEELLESSAAQVQAQLALAQAQDALKDMEYRWRVQQQGNRASGEVIAETEANLVLAEQEVDRAESAFNKLSGRSDDDPARALARSNLADARQKRDAILRNLNWYTGKPTDLDQAILDAELAQAVSNLADAERAWERVEDGPNPDDVKAAEARVTAARATLDLAQITAPFAGSVTKVGVQEGDQVVPGTVAFEVADLSRLLVDVQVSELDINSIQIGQPVNISFDAILGQEYQGEVMEAGLTGTVTQGAVNFEVTVLLTDADSRVRPGMTAAVNLVVNQLEDVLLVPNRAVRVLEGERVVYTLNEGVLEPRMVVLGASSDLYSEVVDGELKAGDPVVLNPPMEFDPQGPPPFVGR